MLHTSLKIPHYLPLPFSTSMYAPRGSHTGILIIENKKAFAAIVSANLKFCGCLKTDESFNRDVFEGV